MGGATDWTDDDYSELIDINEPILPEYFLTFIPTVQSQIRLTYLHTERHLPRRGPAAACRICC